MKSFYNYISGYSNETKVNLANTLYKEPNPIKNYPMAQYLSLAGRNIDSLEELKSAKYLESLNISFTKVKSVEPLKSLPLKELQMMEVKLNNPNELTDLKTLERLKISNDKLGFTKPFPSIKVLHCTTIYYPERLYTLFPNLKTLKFQRILPENKVDKIYDYEPDDYEKEILKYYGGLEYHYCGSSRTVIQSNKISLEESFYDPYVNCPIQNYIKEFFNGNLRITKKDRSKHCSYSIVLSTYCKEWLECDEGNKLFHEGFVPIAKTDGEYRDKRMWALPWAYENCDYRLLKDIKTSGFKWDDFDSDIKRAYYGYRKGYMECTWSVGWVLDKLFKKEFDDEVKNRIEYLVNIYYEKTNDSIELNSEKIIVSELTNDYIKDELYIHGEKVKLSDQEKELFVKLFKDDEVVFNDFVSRNEIVTFDIPTKVQMARTNPIKKQVDDDTIELTIEDEPLKAAYKIGQRFGFNYDSSRFYLNFYGKPINMSQEVRNNNEGKILIGESGDTGIFGNLQDIVVKNRRYQFNCHNLFFFFNGRVYTNLFNRDYLELLNEENIRKLNDGTVGWGCTFYAFDVLTEINPEINTSREIIINL